MKHVAFLGLGNMGRPMAANLLKAGFPVTVYNRSIARTQELVQLGASAAATIPEAVQGTEVIITMVSDNAAVQEVILGEDGVLSAMIPGQILIDMSTVSPDISRQMAAATQAAGVDYLDAPVSGSIKPATEGTLVILVGGDAEVYTRCLPIFQAMGKAIFHLGPNGAGSHMKVCMNALLGVIMQSIGEVTMLAEKGGLTREQMLNVINVSACQTPIAKIKTPAYLADQYPAAFALKHMTKDFGFAMEQAQKLQVAMPIISAGNETFKGALNLGYGDLDIAGIIKMLERLSGVR